MGLVMGDADVTPSRTILFFSALDHLASYRITPHRTAPHRTPPQAPHRPMGSLCLQQFSGDPPQLTKDDSRGSSQSESLPRCKDGENKDALRVHRKRLKGLHPMYNNLGRVVCRDWMGIIR